jgi:Phosphotransferase enzyme family
MLQELEAYCRQRRLLFYPKTDLPLPQAILDRGALGTDPQAAEMDRLVSEAATRIFPREQATIAPLKNQGTFHRLYRAQLLPGRNVIVRVNALSQWQRDFTLLLDEWAMERLRQAGLPHLGVYGVDLSRCLCTFDYQLHQEAPGVTFQAFDHDEEKIRPLLFELGQMVGRLHHLRTEGFGLFDITPLVANPSEGPPLQGTFATWPEYVSLNLGEHIEKCVAAAAISAEEAERISEVFEVARGMLLVEEPCLLHGDLGNHNLFTDGKDVSALIDWEDCLSGDPVFDIAFWATFHPQGRHQCFLDGYRQEHALPMDFELRFWIYFLRISLSKTVLRQRFGVQDKPGRAPASRRIQLGLEKAEALLPGIKHRAGKRVGKDAA